MTQQKPMNRHAPHPQVISEHDPDALYFLPLGGSGEIGMNLNLYGYRGQWLIVDCGVTFGEEEHQPGVDVIMADPAFIVERRDQLLGIVATHAHEDHIGAIPYLWPQLRCPVWATPFTASVLRAKLVEARLAGQVTINTVPMSGRFTIGPFDLELITLTHSIPEPNAVVIRTSAGTVLHTGDWKLDPTPVIGPPTDEALDLYAELARVVREGDAEDLNDRLRLVFSGFVIETIKDGILVMPLLRDDVVERYADPSGALQVLTSQRTSLMAGDNAPDNAAALMLVTGDEAIRPPATSIHIGTDARTSATYHQAWLYA